MAHEFPCPYPEFLRAYALWKHDGTPFPDQGLVHSCFMWGYIYNQPLPRELVGLLVREFEEVYRGHDSQLFSKSTTKDGHTKSPRTHIEAAYLEKRAVSYVKTNRRTGWDKEPVKTICESFRVKRQTVYDWEKKYPTARDDYTKEGMSQLLEELAPLYAGKKKP